MYMADKDICHHGYGHQARYDLATFLEVEGLEKEPHKHIPSYISSMVRKDVFDVVVGGRNPIYMSSMLAKEVVDNIGGFRPCPRMVATRNVVSL